ncbi:UNVERIFIED_ORG: hypothetical protein J2W87_001386 [Pseudomonas putida]|jgi:hypothetical protein|uniref:hypothetical protein n=1 Tax=unclassified Pseudomonas TaxID=196821 RepID=UPI00138ADAA4|nr:MULTISPECIES: hypothetical protein [unclassified Pseudomonas]MBV7572516.1 hypothetical protein [Pseudomonas sp. PDM32]MDP9653477.1 hypothetical protein [Pseudomonas putida]
MGRLQKGFFYKIKTIAWAMGAVYQPEGLIIRLLRQLKTLISPLMSDKAVCLGEKTHLRCPSLFIGGFV